MTSHVTSETARQASVHGPPCVLISNSSSFPSPSPSSPHREVFLRTRVQDLPNRPPLTTAVDTQHPWYGENHGSLCAPSGAHSGLIPHWKSLLTHPPLRESRIACSTLAWRVRPPAGRQMSRLVGSARPQCSRSHVTFSRRAKIN